jgi:hypothetical protein
MLKKLLVVGLFMVASYPPRAFDEKPYSHPILDNTAWYATEDILKHKIDSVGITNQQIHDYCRQTLDKQRQKMLISLACLRMENYAEEGNSDYWASILYNLDRFVEVVGWLKEPSHRSFMDVGSSNGEKLFAASCLGFESLYGLEYAPELVDLSKNQLKELVNKGSAHISTGDALEIDSSYYAQADFIYMYSPIKDSRTMARLYKRILDNMKEEAVLLEVRMVYFYELAQLTGLDFPNIMERFAVRKSKGKLYYAIFDGYGQKEWIEIKPLH